MAKQQKADVLFVQNSFDLIPEDIKLSVQSIIDVNENKTLRTVKVSSQFPVSKFNTYQELKNKDLSNLGEEAKEVIEKLIVSLKPQYEIGDKFQKVVGLHSFDSQSNAWVEAEFQPLEGVVTLVDFWATWCGPCQKPMEHNQKLLEENYQWEGKVQIVGLSVDDDNDSVQKRILDKKWTSVRHFRFNNGWDKDNFAIQASKIRGIPFVTLLNKHCEIVYKGHPSKVDLKTKIDELIASEAHQERVFEPTQFQKDDKQLEKQKQKELIKNAKEFSQKVKDAKLEGSYEIKIVKEYLLNRGGAKEFIKRTGLQVSYEVNIKEKQQVEALNQQLKETFGEDVVQFTKQVINDPEGAKTRSKEKLQQLFKEHNVNLSYETQRTQSFVFKNGQFVESTRSEDKLQIDKYPATIYKTIVEKFTEFVQQEVQDEEQQESLLELVEQSKSGCQLVVGDQFQTITNYKKIFSTDLVEVKHQQGQILVIDYWAHWCGPCRTGLTKNYKIVKQNKEQWGDKVRFVALSLQSEAESLEFLKTIEESFAHIEYHFPTKENQEDQDIYGVRYIPHYVVVNQQGIIKNVGSVANLEETVNNLLANKEPIQIEQQVGAKPSLEQSQQLIAFLKQVPEEIKEFQPGFEFKIQIVSDVTQAEGQEQLSIKSLNYNYFAREKQVEQLNAYLQKIFAIIPEDQFKGEKEVGKTFDIPYPGGACVLCNQQSGDQYYWSPFKNEFVCAACAEFVDNEKVGIERYKYQDSLIFVNGPIEDLKQLQEIDDYKKGKNLKPEVGVAASQRHSMRCNGCNVNAEGPRYIGIKCRPGKLRGDGYIDYCTGCFNNLRNKNSEEAQKIIKADEAEGVTKDSPYLRILFNLGYYEF
ncbi:hypothetical protein pb186bvf_011415 [Paramecium bursaria]